MASKFGKSEMASIETDKRIKKQKQQFEQLLKEYHKDVRKEETKKLKDQQKLQKIAARDEKIKNIK